MRPNLVTIDVSPGEYYWLDSDKGRRLAMFQRITGQSMLEFRDEKLDEPLIVPPHLFERMRSDGGATRVPRKAIKSRDPSKFDLGDIHPLSLLDPEEDGISSQEKEQRLCQWRKLERSRILSFCATEYDDAPHLGRGHKAIDAHFASKDMKARFKERGFIWRPDAATILRAVDKCGAPQSRPLSAFFNDVGKHDRSKRYEPEMLEWAQQMSDGFWSSIENRYCDVREKFYAKIDAENARRARLGLTPMARPSPETIRTWIDEDECWYTWKARYGEKSANGRFKGRGISMDATRPFEIVLMDHTRVDAWALIEDEFGRVVMRERPWLTLAIDVYSRMVLGAVLSFEPPSVYTALLCLRQVVRQKDFLEPYGFYKGATDGWGKPLTVVCDNGWEFTGLSFAAVCESAGIHVVWAPIRTPQFKAIVEAFFHRLNQMLWHRLPSGILKIEDEKILERKPELMPTFRIEDLNRKLWDGIVTMYHCEVHSSIGMAPAQKLQMGFQQHERPTVDDVALLDKLLGNVHRCVLSPEGVAVDGERFHDPAATSALLETLLKHGAKRSRRKGYGAGGTVGVIVTSDRVDASYVHVWDHVTKQQVRLPNIDRHVHGLPTEDGAPAQGLSWRIVKAIKAFAAERNLEFHSREDKAAARAAYYGSLPKRVSDMPFREARRYAADFERSPTLVDGNIVAKHVVEATVSGTATDVPRSMPAKERDGALEIPMGPRRGRKKGSGGRKPKKPEAASTPLMPPPVPPEPAVPSWAAYQILDPVAALDALDDDF